MGCKKLSYHPHFDLLKGGSKKELTSKNSVSNLRSGYIYAFQGQEHDDEIKGEGNSYDFGARMLDPRLGRWLTIDPQSLKQPSQSPYKAFFNNPLYWSDPEGKTEFETIVIKDEQTGKSMRIYVSKSNKVKTDGQVHYDEMNQLPYQEYYDYAHVTTLTTHKDGSTSITKTEEILKKNGVKYTDYVPIDNLLGTTAKKGSIHDPDDPFTQSGGFYMTGEKGEGTKYHSKNAEYVGNVDALISALGGLTEGGVVKKSSKFSSDELLGMLKALSEAPEKADNVKKLYDEIVGGGSSSDEMSKKTKPYSNTTTWERDDSDNGYSGTNYPASKQERLSGDTLGGKNEPKHSWTSPSGKKVISNTHPTSIKQIK